MCMHVVVPIVPSGRPLRPSRALQSCGSLFLFPCAQQLAFILPPMCPQAPAAPPPPPLPGVSYKRKLAEFRVTPDALLPVGHELRASHFVAGQFVDVTGTSIGKGFQGVMKRWGFAGQPASHGNSLSHRAAGSTGACQVRGAGASGGRIPVCGPVLASSPPRVAWQARLLQSSTVLPPRLQRLNFCCIGVVVLHQPHHATGCRGGCFTPPLLPMQDPGKVFKGKKMAGRMGGERVTVQNCQVGVCPGVPTLWLASRLRWCTAAARCALLWWALILGPQPQLAAGGLHVMHLPPPTPPAPSPIGRGSHRRSSVLTRCATCCTCAARCPGTRATGCWSRMQ